MALNSSSLDTIQKGYQFIVETAKKEHSKKSDKTDPEKVAKITKALENVFVSYSSDPNATEMLKWGLIRWIDDKITPLTHHPETKLEFQQWMKHLASARLPFSTIPFNPKTCSVDVLANIHENMEKSFGKENSAIPFVQYLLKDFSSLEETSKKLLISFISKLPKEQMDADFFNAILYQSYPQKTERLEIIKLALVQEIEEAENHELIFRNSPFCMKLFRHYCKSVCKDWLHFIFNPLTKIPKLQACTPQYFSKKIVDRIRLSIPLPSLDSSPNAPHEKPVSLVRTDTGKKVVVIPENLWVWTEVVRQNLCSKFSMHLDQVRNMHMQNLFLYTVVHALTAFTEWDLNLSIPHSIQDLLPKIRPLLQDATASWDTAVSGNRRSNTLSLSDLKDVRSASKSPSMEEKKLRKTVSNSKKD